MYWLVWLAQIYLLSLQCLNKAIVDSILRPRSALPSPFPADNAFSMGKKTPSRRQAMRPITNMSEDRATDIGNMHKKLVNMARVVPEISSRTDRPTDRHSHHKYFATAPVGEVIIWGFPMFYWCYVYVLCSHLLKRQHCTRNCKWLS